MKKLSASLLAACSLPLLISCAGTGKEPSAALRVEPGLFVHNADAGADGFYRLGRHHQEQNRLEQAADTYRKAIGADGAHVEARNALATVYAAQGKTNEAIAEFMAILKAAPRLAHVRNNLGYAYYLQGKYAEAADALEKAAALEPGNPRTFTNLGLSYQQMGEQEKSRAAFAHAEKLGAPAPVPAAAASSNGPGAVAEPVRIASAAPVIPLDPISQPLAMQPPAAAALPPSSSLPPSLPSTAASGAASPVRAAATANDTGYRLVIADGSGVDGFAARIAGALALDGIPAPQVNRLKPGTQQRVVILYRDGFADQARRLAKMFARPPALVKNGDAADEADVRLVLGMRAASGDAALVSDAPLAAASRPLGRAAPAQ